MVIAAGSRRGASHTAFPRGERGNELFPIRARWYFQRECVAAVAVPCRLGGDDGIVRILRLACRPVRTSALVRGGGLPADSRNASRVRLTGFSMRRAAGHSIYRIVILDGKGQSRSGLAIVGKPFWFSFSCRGCPVEVQWDSPTEVVRRLEPVAHLTVFCFAAADLIIAILLLAAVLGILFVIALCLDHIWDGTWGLNHRLGRVPRPNARDETRQFMIQMLGCPRMLSGRILDPRGRRDRDDPETDLGLPRPSGGVGLGRTDWLWDHVCDPFAPHHAASRIQGLLFKHEQSQII